MIFDYFDGAFYLNLDSRTDRREQFEMRTKHFGFGIERFPAFQFNKEDVNCAWGDDRWYIKISCTQSHINMVREAKNRGWKNCLIFEDDCVFTEEYLSNMQKCVDDLKNVEWDLFYMGGEPNDYCTPITENIYKTNGVYGTHSYAINHTFYDKILSVTPASGVIDTIYLSWYIADKKYIIAKELLVLQDDESMSDLWGHNKKSVEIYKNAYKKWMI